MTDERITATRNPSGGSLPLPTSWIGAPERECPDLLRDESQCHGQAEALVMAESEADVVAALRQATARNMAVTLQGARTGIAAGAVPAGGLVLNLSRMDRILGCGLAPRGRPWLRVQPGLSLAALRRWLAAPQWPVGLSETSSENEVHELLSRRRWRFTPDPTETGATLGGMVACNASGARSFYFGATRRWIDALRIVLPDGDTLTLRRGTHRTAGGRFRLQTDSGREIFGKVPACRPPAVKHAAGYWLADDMDLVDLFVGSEGTLGVIVEIDLILCPAPGFIRGVQVFVPDEDTALSMTSDLRRAAGESRNKLGARLVAIEYYDTEALRLLAALQQRVRTAFPPLPEPVTGSLFIEIESDDAGQLAATTEQLAGWLSAAGCDPATNVWAADTPRDLDVLKQLRHAVPEEVNRIVAERRRQYPDLTKVGTDLAMPDHRLVDMAHRYRRDLAEHGLHSVVFGHVGDNHLHVNILPQDMDECRRGRELYRHWARQSVAWGGTVAAEHGIGKLKTNLLGELYRPDELAEMRRLRRRFDPDERLNRGVLFGE